MQTETEREIELLRARVRMLEDAAGHAAPPERFSAVLLDELLSDFGEAFDDSRSSRGTIDVGCWVTATVEAWLRAWFAGNRVLLGRPAPPPDLPPSALDPLTLPPPGDEPPAGPEIVCLCGSTRFYQAFQEANYRETMAGRIVLSVGFYPRTEKRLVTVDGCMGPQEALVPVEHGSHVGCTPAEKAALDELHLRKIDLCHLVFVLNVGGYVGESTRREIDYALAHGKRVEYLEPPGPSCSPETLARRRADGREDDGSLGG